MNLEAEPEVYATEFQKASTKRAAGESGGSEFWKKAAASYQDLPSSATNDRNFICAIVGMDVQRLHIIQIFQLNAFRPVVR